MSQARHLLINQNLARPAETKDDAAMAALRPFHPLIASPLASPEGGKLLQTLPAMAEVKE